jgi:hypothetical protein
VITKMGRHSTQPIAVDDAVRYLAGVLVLP